MDPPHLGAGAQLGGGRLNAAIANELGRLVAAFTGRGPTSSRAFIHQDVVVWLTQESVGRLEGNLVTAGRADLVREQREAVQRALEPQLAEAVAQLTRRRVRAVMGGPSLGTEDAVEVFLLEPEVAGAASEPDAST